MCAEELIWLAGQVAETLFTLIATRDPNQLGVLECLSSDIMHHIIEESEECLGTDDVLNNLFELFETSFASAIVYFRARAWDNLQELATHITTVRDQLIEELGRLRCGQDITAT